MFGRHAAAAETRDEHALASYAVDTSRPLAERVAPIPDWLLALWRERDQAPSYENHALTPDEKREFSSAINGLPPRMRKALGERMIAFYFVSNLRGNGITDWALDASNRTYAYMILNPAAFDKTLSQLLTQRERSAFRGVADLSVDAEEGGSGIIYTVAHECTHAFDYARGLTPFVGPQVARARNRRPRLLGRVENLRPPARPKRLPHSRAPDLFRLRRRAEARRRRGTRGMRAACGIALHLAVRQPQLGRGRRRTLRRAPPDARPRPPVPRALRRQGSPAHVRAADRAARGTAPRAHDRRGRGAMKLYFEHPASMY